MSVNLLSVLSAAKAHLAPLAGESAGYLVLAVADQVASAPRVVSAESVELLPDGSLRLRAGAATSSEAAEHSLRMLLDQLLLTASTASAALMRASRRHAAAGVESLIREVEAALIPVNRAAAKRTLARLYRETSRALEAGRLSLPVPTPALAPEPPAPPSPAPERVLAPAPAAPLDAFVYAKPEGEIALPPVISKEATSPVPLIRQPELVSETPRLGTVLASFDALSKPADSATQEPPQVEGYDEPSDAVRIEWDVDEIELESALAKAPQYSFIVEDSSDYSAPLPAFELTPCEAALDTELTEPIPLVARELDVPSPKPPVTLTDSRSDVSQLAESFGVQGMGAQESDLWRALRELAGLELTPGQEATLSERSQTRTTKAR